ncbi:SMC-Scp complex subunit ScpB [Cellvibrio sp.]|uniref:SMC-Scp complex subunit ScpB n=1 Tax=Cellvibrio sp. TaxID=1965322 RepID=UPI003964856E
MTDENNLENDLDSEEVGAESAAVSEHDDTNEESATVAITQQPVDKDMLRKIVEGAILAAAQPLTIARILELFDEEVAPAKDEVLAALQDIQADNAERGFELKEVASGWRFQVRGETAPWVNRLWDEKPQKYSRALLETLALIAYRQPITRGDIEEIRGVAVSSHIMKTLMERDWVKVVGHRDVPGRPSLYATTRQFLDYFNLKNLEDLPSLSEIRDLDELNNVLDLGEEGLGEKDEDVITESSASPENLATEPEEFVDGEEAFVDADEESPSLNTESDAANLESESSADDLDEHSDEENNNA